MADIFVSCASEDVERVKPLVSALEDVLEDQDWSLCRDWEIGTGSSYDQVINTRGELDRPDDDPRQR